MSDWATGTSPPPGPAVTLAGELGFLHDPTSRELLATIGSWRAELDGPRTTVTVDGGPRWLGAPVSGSLRLTLAAGNVWASGVGESQRLLAWTWKAHEPLERGASLLDDFSVPLAASVPLPEGGEWRVRSIPRHAMLTKWAQRLRKDGATPRTWALLIAAYDEGWSLKAPSPARMRGLSGWKRVPTTVAGPIVDYLAAQAAGALAESGAAA